MSRFLRALVALVLLISPVMADGFVMPGDRARHYEPTPNRPLPPIIGGTGLSSPAANSVLLTYGAAAFQTVAPGTSGNVLTSNGTTWQSSASHGETLLCDNTLGSAQTNMDCGSLATTYNMFRVEVVGAGLTTGTGITVNLSISSDGGSTFETQSIGGNSAGSTYVGNFWISAVGLTANKILNGNGGNGTVSAVTKMYSTKTSPTNFIRYSYASSTVTSGSRMRVFGIN